MDDDTPLLDIEDALLPEEAPPASRPSPLAAARAAPAPATLPPGGGLPAYGLTATSTAGGGVTTRDLKAAGIGALAVLALGWLVRMISRG